MPGLYVAKSALSDGGTSSTLEETKLQLEQAQSNVILETAKLFNKVHDTFLDGERGDHADAKRYVLLVKYFWSCVPAAMLARVS